MKCEELVEELKNLLIESSFASRWALIEGYHQAGRLIFENAAPKTELVKDLALKVGVSQRKLWYALAFYEKFPSLDLLPEGKDTNWWRIVNKYLTQPSKETSSVSLDSTDGNTITCPSCGFSFQPLSKEQNLSL